MLYEEARVYLDHVSKYGSVLGLESIKSLLGELANPQNDLKFIHIAGTNGKGSILAELSEILTSAGYRVGRYCSPTVLDYLERFQIDGLEMKKEDYARLTEQVKQAAERGMQKGGRQPTAFEIETAIAFLYFKEKRCDYVVLETGLGGKEDATNVIEHPLLSVFASISMDHMACLGNTLEEIALQKAGIIKPGAAVVTGPQSECVMEVLEKTAHEKGCICYLAEPVKVRKSDWNGQAFLWKGKTYFLPLLGRFQLENVAVVLQAVECLRTYGIEIPDAAIKEGLSRVQWPGRFQALRYGDTKIILDGAHNAQAALRLKENIEAYLTGQEIVAITGIFRDKDYGSMVQTLAPHFSYVYTIDLPNRERTLHRQQLQKAWKDAGVSAESVDNISKALELAIKRAGERGVVLVCGSLSYLGEVLRILQA